MLTMQYNIEKINLDRQAVGRNCRRGAGKRKEGRDQDSGCRNGSARKFTGNWARNTGELLGEGLTVKWKPKSNVDVAASCDINGEVAAHDLVGLWKNELSPGLLCGLSVWYRLCPPG